MFENSNNDSILNKSKLRLVYFILLKDFLKNRYLLLLHKHFPMIWDRKIFIIFNF